MCVYCDLNKTKRVYFQLFKLKMDLLRNMSNKNGLKQGPILLLTMCKFKIVIYTDNIH